ncbi:hypothetical protein HHK36_015186 [Tetracentron sinense]|uniref:Uncharacterized protein n=1 Tax=Tetracentron sinense TaxID=13715 RepID=A0A834Z8S0_TETSI|nr:hypothetical protein HHK36_015186 [Tetracentron sinense]
MSQKRPPDDGKVGSEGNNPEEKRLRLSPLESTLKEGMKKKDAVQNLCSALEPWLRNVVKEEIEVAFREHSASKIQNCGDQIHPSTSRSIKLQFTNRISLPVFAGSRIKGAEDSTIKVVVVDALTGQVVDSGPGSSAKVEIVVLKGDFEDDKDNWTFEEFNNNIVQEREGKKPLIKGDLFLNLIEGTGVVGGLVFTDNSSRTRNGKFRLGARVVNGSDGIRVREAKSEPFIVKDHRGESCKKHHPPSLIDEVWRLENIGKDGAFHMRLKRESIYTVKDFLTVFWTDTPRLRNVTLHFSFPITYFGLSINLLLFSSEKILGTNMSNKKWEVTVEHARTCPLEKRRYLYWQISSQRRMGVVFDVVGKDDAQKLVKAAYEHWEEVVSCDDGITMGGSSHIPNVCFPSSSTASGFGFIQPSAFSLDNVSSIRGMWSLDDYTFKGLETVNLRYTESFNLPSQVTNSPICDRESPAQTSCDEECMQHFDLKGFLQTQNLSLESQTDPTSAVSAFLVSGQSTHVKAQTRWTTLSVVLRWRFSIKRIVVSKKSGVQEMEQYS